jgi:hypothetical protein
MWSGGAKREDCCDWERVPWGSVRMSVPARIAESGLDSQEERTAVCAGERAVNE